MVQRKEEVSVGDVMVFVKTEFCGSKGLVTEVAEKYIFMVPFRYGKWDYSSPSRFSNAKVNDLLVKVEPEK